MEKRQSLKQLLEHQRVFAPCIWDCMSAKAAEMSGFPATLLSSGCMSFSMRGLPDMGLLTLDEVLMMTERITNVSSLPLIWTPRTATVTARCMPILQPCVWLRRVHQP